MEALKCQACGATAVEPCQKEEVVKEEDCVRNAPDNCPECGASAVESCMKDEVVHDVDCARNGNEY